jgi:hypothetical protein
MTNLLICESRSFSGSLFVPYVTNYLSDYSVITLDKPNCSWEKADSFGYSVTAFVAGIAEVNPMKYSQKKKQKHQHVNAHLPNETTKKTMQAGISRFDFHDSTSVYDKSRSNNIKILKIPS